ncbi:MAG: VOC family protein [Acidobacteriaceae bacterium]|nr:VOC family protein [Acidobacteriaceae bacterium]
MARIVGIGGVFFKSENPAALYSWYEQHLGIRGKPGEGGLFSWRRSDDPSKEEQTVWSIFPANTAYFGQSKSGCMLNYIVDDLDGLLQQLRAEGVAVDERTEECSFGKFGWITDPDGNRLELWEPKPEG